MSRGDSLLPRIVLDRGGPIPLQRQLRDQLTAAICASIAGTRLPSSRLLARLLGVSRNTVLACYDDLAADGLIEGRPGSAMVVSRGRAPRLDLLTTRTLLREAGYPGHVVEVLDVDGNPLFFTN